MGSWCSKAKPCKSIKNTNVILRERFCEQFFKFILAKPDKPWDWFNLSNNPSITWKNVQENLDKPLNWIELSCNPSITWKHIQENPDKPWAWYWIGSNRMGYPYTKKIKKIKTTIHWKMLEKHNNLLGYDRRLNRYNFYLFMQHLS